MRGVTANLPLWPRTQVVVMGQAAYDRLSDDQKHVLAKAARAAIGPSRPCYRGVVAQRQPQLLCQ